MIPRPSSFEVVSQPYEAEAVHVAYETGMEQRRRDGYANE